MKNCKNCNSPYASEDVYCPKCGAKWIDERLTFKHAVSEFSERYLGTDNVFFKTFIHLFTKPEAVILDYINGVRKRYVNVISYFLIALTFAGLQVFVIKSYGIDIQGVAEDANENEIKVASMIGDLTTDYQSLIMIISIPLIAFIGYVVWLTLKRYNFIEQLVMVTYVYAQYSLCTVAATVVVAVTGLNFQIFSLFTSFLIFAYGIYAYYRIYRISVGGFILRTLLFLFLILVVFSLLSILAGIIMVIINPEMIIPKQV